MSRIISVAMRFMFVPPDDKNQFKGDLWQKYVKTKKASKILNSSKRFDIPAAQFYNMCRRKGWRDARESDSGGGRQRADRRYFVAIHQKRGVADAGGEDRRGGARPVRRGRAVADPAGYHAAGAGRAGGLPPHPPGVERADSDDYRQGRGRGSDSRAGYRRGRLHRQAVFPRRGDGADSRGAAAHPGGGGKGNAGDRRAVDSPAVAVRHAVRAQAEPDAAGGRAAVHAGRVAGARVHAG